MQMFCPRCGHRESEAVPFCRNCGLRIEAHARLLNDDADTAVLPEANDLGPSADSLITDRLERPSGLPTRIETTIPVLTGTSEGAVAGSDAGDSGGYGILYALQRALANDTKRAEKRKKFPLLPTLRYTSRAVYERAEELDALDVLSSNCQAVLLAAFAAMTAFDTYADRYSRETLRERAIGDSQQGLANAAPEALRCVLQGVEVLTKELDRLAGDSS